MVVGCHDGHENQGDRELCISYHHLKRTSKEENESELGLPWVVAPKHGNNVCMKCLLVSKEKSFSLFVIGGCGTHRRVHHLFMVLGLAYLNKLFMCLN